MMGPGNTPSAEIDVDADLVRRLLADQHPDLADARVELVASGWDNVTFRLGDDLAVRLPRRSAAAELVEREQRWLPVLAPGLPLPVPVPVRVGRPTAYYPWSWSVVPWFDGRPAGTDPELDGELAARDLGAFLAALHRPAPAAAPTNPVRGIPLARRDDATKDRLARLPGDVDASALARRWEHCLAAPAWDGPPLWLHGDLHAHNVLSRQGRIVAVIDFGDITAGDPATDLAVAWSLLGPDDRPAFREAASTPERPVDDAMWTRAEGWALSVGIALLAASADAPAMAAMARRMIGAG